MTQTELIEIQQCLSCSIAAYGDKLNKGLSVGKCVDSVVDNIFIAESLLNVVSNYTPDSECFYAYKLLLVKLYDEEYDDFSDVDLDIIAGGEIIASYVGTVIPTAAFTTALNSAINAGTESTGYSSYVDTDGNLVFWSCDEESKAAPYLSAEWTTSPIGAIYRFDLERQDGFLDTVTAENNITEEELCSVISKIKNIINC